MSTFKFRCVFCRQKIEAEESWIGMFAECPSCGRRIEVRREDEYAVIAPLSPEPEPGRSFLSLAFPARSFWTDLAWAAVIGEGLLLLTCFLSPCSSGALWRFPHWLVAGLGILAGVWISAGWIAALVFAWFGVTRGEDEKRCGQVRTVALILGIVLIPGGLLPAF